MRWLTSEGRGSESTWLIMRRIASARGGLSGCCLAHASMAVRIFGERRIELVGSRPVAGLPGRRGLGVSVIDFAINREYQNSRTATRWSGDPPRSSPTPCPLGVHHGSAGWPQPCCDFSRPSIRQFSRRTPLPRDQREDDMRSLVFETTSLDKPIEILGAAIVTLDVASDQPIANLVVRLRDV